MQEILFTRAGNFKVDESGALVTSAGANVMGWQVDETGKAVKDVVSKLYVNSPEFAYTSPQRTSAVNFTGNINASSKDTITTTLNFYDSVGNSYQATVNLSYAGVQGDNTQYTMSCVGVSKNGNPTDLTFTASGPLSLIHLQVLLISQMLIYSLHFLTMQLYRRLMKTLILELLVRARQVLCLLLVHQVLQCMQIRHL